MDQVGVVEEPASTCTLVDPLLVCIQGWLIVPEVGFVADTMVGIPYFRMSKRVKATFVN